MKHNLEDILNIKSETLNILNTKEMSRVKGGFLSIGHKCSANASCSRLKTKPGSTCCP